MKEKLLIKTSDKWNNIVAIGHASAVKLQYDNISMISRNHRFRV